MCSQPVSQPFICRCLFSSSSRYNSSLSPTGFSSTHYLVPPLLLLQKFRLGKNCLFPSSNLSHSLVLCLALNNSSPGPGPDLATFPNERTTRRNASRKKKVDRGRRCNTAGRSLERSVQSLSTILDSWNEQG